MNEKVQNLINFLEIPIKISLNLRRILTYLYVILKNNTNRIKWDSLQIKIHYFYQIKNI